MKKWMLALAVGLAMSAPAAAQDAAAAAPAALPANIAAAGASPARADDAQNDARRHGGDIVAFAGVKPGDTVIELIPGGGYFTRLFSKAVGDDGKVYAVWPTEYDESTDKLQAIADAYGNIEILKQSAAALSAPAQADVVFTSQNYHDYPDKFMGPVDLATFDKQVFDALKPGGVFVVVDHAAETGSGLRDTETLHRIDPEIVKQQVEAAGFEFVGESEVLRNPADDHTLKVFDKTIRGRTDQFVYKFRKP
ncbi:MAG: class I SAM-dependent methyltransferase [Luteimonas sp.]